MVGSSSTYSAHTSPEPSCDASRMRCASPPESVLARRPRAREASPTSSINLSREEISLTTVLDISCSFLESSSPSKNSYAFCMESLVTSTMFMFAKDGPLRASPKDRPWRNTLRASGRRRVPLHTGHCSSLKKCLVPRPLHAGQAPYGELNENRRGSTSGKENPSYAHMNLLEIVRVVPASSTFTS